MISASYLDVWELSITIWFFMMIPYRWRRKTHSRSPVMVLELLVSLLGLVGSVGGTAPHYGGEQLPLIPHQGVQEDPSASHQSHDFSLRHIFHHGTYDYPQLHKRLDVNPEDTLWAVSEEGQEPVSHPRLRASSQPVKIQRLVDRRVGVMEERLEAARNPGIPRSLTSSEWTLDELPGPNITDKNTVVDLARMAANSYIMEPGTEKWVDVSGPFNHSQNFGWEQDGLRGHIYADDKNSTIVVAMKGTSTALFDGEETTTNDKENDNLFFSCCCAQGGNYFWRQVCDCYATTYTCNSTCVVGALRRENRYYRASLDLYANVTALYPESNVWLVGHSLGGAVSSFLGLTYGVPVVTFEAVPEALPASRLGLPTPPGSDPNFPQRRSYTGAYHFGHTADPVYMGTCNGATSVCTLGGYALETSCHTGHRCVYDTVEDLGWRVGIGTHRILSVISDVMEEYDGVPFCEPDTVCVDCVNWKFFESNSSDPITTTTTSSTSPGVTRTSTCETPGWWGCRDKTTSETETTTTSTSSTSTCETPGWFGCNDPTSTTTDTTTTAPATTTATPTDSPSEGTSSTLPSSTSSCENPGWFGGCNDPTSTSPSPVPTSSPAETHSCETPGRFWGCWDSSSATTTPTSPITSSAVLG